MTKLIFIRLYIIEGKKLIVFLKTNAKKGYIFVLNKNFLIFFAKMCDEIDFQLFIYIESKKMLVF